MMKNFMVIEDYMTVRGSVYNIVVDEYNKLLKKNRKLKNKIKKLEEDIECFSAIQEYMRDDELDFAEAVLELTEFLGVKHIEVSDKIRKITEMAAKRAKTYAGEEKLD